MELSKSRQPDTGTRRSRSSRNQGCIPCKILILKLPKKIQISLSVLRPLFDGRLAILWREWSSFNFFVPLCQDRESNHAYAEVRIHTFRPPGSASWGAKKEGR